MAVAPPGTASTGAARALHLITKHRWALGVWLGGVACVVVMLLPIGSPSRVTLIHVSALAALLVCLAALLRMPRRVRDVWWGLWIFMVLTTAGDIVYDVYLYRFQIEPFPSVADVLYLGSYVALIGALAVLVHRRAPGRNRETWIDTAVMTLAAACVVATVVIMPLLTESAAPTLTTVISVAYPLLDVIALSVLIRLLVDVERMNPALALMGVSLACMLTADLVFQSLAAQGLVEEAPAWVDVLFLASTLLLAAAATARGATTITKPSPATHRTKARLVGLAIAALTAPTLMAFSVWSDVGSAARLLAVVSIAIILLILWGSLMLISMVEQQSALLADLARKDGLTGLPNRRTWDFELDRMADRTTEEGTSLVVAMLDLDHFKAYNDRFGHPAGDALLTDCAREWRSHLDPPMVLARYGGEEFAVLMPGVPLKQAGVVLDRLRQATPGAQTVSIGYAAREAGEPIGRTVHRADLALYQAKASGRDCIMVHDGAAVATA